MGKLSKNNIILIGYMGSGKTTIGALLAKKLNYQFYDSDAIIEQREKEKISSIFENQGEEHFRELETKLIMDMNTYMKSSILSTGGGMPLREQNRQLLAGLGFVVYLKTSVKTIVRRLRTDQSRPLLKGDNLEKRIRGMLEVREPIYEGAAHLRIDCDDLSRTEISERIITEYQKWLL